MAFRSLKSRVMLLLVLVALPYLFFIFQYAERERIRLVSDARSDAFTAAKQIALTQQKIISDTREYLEFLVKTDHVRKPDQTECSSFLKSILGLNNTYINIGVPRADGELLCNALPLNRRVNVFDREYFQRSLVGRVFAIGKFQLDRAANKLSVNFSLPVISADNDQVVGVAVAVVSLDWWSKQLGSYDLPEGSVAFIYDYEGTVVATYHGDPSLLGKPISQFGLELDASGDLPQRTEMVSSTDNAQRVFVHVPLFYDEFGDRMYISVGVPVDKTIQAANSVFYRNIAVFCTVIAMVLVVAYRTLIISVISPLSRLINATESIKMGRYSSPDIQTGAEELLALESRFNEMATVLVDVERKRKKLYGVVAHELRTPVAAISMMTEDDSTESWLSHRLHVQRSSRDLLNTIDDMRLLISPDLNRSVRIEGFNVKDLNAAVSSSIAPVIAATGIAYRQVINLPDDLADETFLSDGYRLRVALTNLVRNACLHSKGTQVELRLELCEIESEHRLTWIVEDDGVGLPEDMVDLLFEAGERGQTDSEGSGYGLFITKSWIEEIGGSVSYTPRLKGGSEFSIQLPMVIAQDDRSKEVDAEHDCDVTATILKKLNVLMAEDESTLRLLGQKLLSRIVNEVQVAEDGSKALELMHPSINLVVTDYFMPELNGADFTRKLREDGYAGVIIGVTAATIGDQREDLLKAGADAVLPKPLTPASLKSAIADLVASGRFDELTE